MRATDMKPGKTYRFAADPPDVKCGGTVEVEEAEHDDGMWYVAGFYQQDDGRKSHGWGAFRTDEIVTEVTA